MNDDKNKLPELLSMRYITQRLQIHPNTLRQWEKKGYVICYRVGVRRDRRFLKEDIMRMFRLDSEHQYRIELAQWRKEKAFEAQQRGNDTIY